MLRFLAVVFILAVLVAGAFAWENYNFSAPGPTFAGEPAQVGVVIKPGDGIRRISEKMANAGVIQNALLFQGGVRFRNKQALLKAGEYGIPAGASMQDIMDLLISGKSIEHKITAAEGLTSDMIVKLINADPVLKGPPLADPPEGSLLP